MADPVLAAMDRFRGALDGLTEDARRELLRAYRSGWNSISRELELLQGKIATAPRIATISGTGELTEGIPPSWLFQEERYVALQNEVRGLVSDVGGTLGDTLGQTLPEAWTIGGQEARSAGVNLAEIPIESWASVPTRGFQAFVGGATQGPLGPLLASFVPINGAAATTYARDVLGAGLLRGRSAFAIADDLEAGLSNLTYGRALRIARTETLRAYREGVRANYVANREIVQSWTWRAAVENTQHPPCAACFAKHGSIHPLSEPMETHPNCRCRMVPNRSPVLGISPNNPVLPDAKTAFDKLPAATQRRILGPSRLEMYRAGRVRLEDFATTRARGVWGANAATIRPLSELRQLSSQARALPAASARLFRQAAEAEGDVSAALQRIGEETGAELEGFGFRLKTPDRIAEKIRTDVLDGRGSIVKVSEGINDALRYTYRLDPAKYGANVEAIMRRLQAEGMTVVKTKNFWKSPSGYRGYHAIMRAPNGARFELQFHTAESLAVKERSHVLYEIQRLDSTVPAEKLRLQREIDELWKTLDEPAGASTIPDEILPLVQAETRAPLAGALEQRAAAEAELEQLQKDFVAAFEERNALIRTDTGTLAANAEQINLRAAELRVQMEDLAAKAPELRTKFQAIIRQEEEAAAAQLRTLAVEEARAAAAELRILQAQMDALHRALDVRVPTGTSLELRIQLARQGLVDDIRAAAFRLERLTKEALPLRERIKSFDSIARDSWKGTVRRSYQDAYDRFTNVVEALEAEFEGLRSRWTGVVEGAGRNGGHMSFTGELGLHASYRIDWKTAIDAARVLERRRLLEAGFDVEDPFWQKALEDAVEQRVLQKALNQYKVMIHEGLHSLSPVGAAEYRLAAGFEEGIVEGLTKAVESRIWKRLGLNVAEGEKSYGTYANYVGPLERVREIVGKEPLDFYGPLLRMTIQGRQHRIGEWIDQAIARSPEKREEFLALATALRKALSGKTRFR